MEFISVESNAKEVTENVEKPTENTETEEETHTYNISAEYKKSTYQTEHWSNIISTGKYVTLLVTTYFRWGSFEIILTDKEKEEILKKESIVINDYDCSCNELIDGCSQDDEIENEEQYTEEELREIKKLIYWYQEETDDEMNEEYDSEEEYILDMDVLEANGWDLSDTTYGIDSTCELELISD